MNRQNSFEIGYRKSLLINRFNKSKVSFQTTLGLGILFFLVLKKFVKLEQNLKNHISGCDSCP